MSASIPERARWAVEVLDPGADEHLLEIGCGPGAAAELVCARLDAGRLLAIDRSAVAVQRTLRRNAAHMDAGRLEVRQCALDALDVAPGRLDAVFSVDVNLFWTRDPAAELAVLARALRPGGRLLILYGASGPTTGDRVISPITAALEAHGFTGVTPLDDPRGAGLSSTKPGERPARP
ncbi:class I SAM-dependent methyltransferase [Actinocorallia sp. B10E7]|uniref:class I SAM-dependent methyltransferase n=1 Tax=Actinocorallia sp. B10E7 TaxID=3153558 RepID=UPI00325F92C0